MDVFACGRCDAVLTAPVSRVALPAHAHGIDGNDRRMPALMEPGTYAVDPEPFGPPWRPWHEVDEREAEVRGVYAPVHGLSFGTPGPVVLAPGDAHGTVLIPGRHGGHCCGLDGGDGPNLARARCGRPVATRIDDCRPWQATWLEPSAVRRVTVGPARPVADWRTVHARSIRRPAPRGSAWCHVVPQGAIRCHCALLWVSGGAWHGNGSSWLLRVFPAQSGW